MKKLKSILLLGIFLVIAISCSNDKSIPTLKNLNIQDAEKIFLGKWTSSKGPSEDAYLLKMEQEVIEKVDYELADHTITDEVFAELIYYIRPEFFIVKYRFYGNYLVDRRNGNCYKIDSLPGQFASAMLDDKGDLYFTTQKNTIEKIEFLEDGTHREIQILNLEEYQMIWSEFDFTMDSDGNFACCCQTENNGHFYIFIFDSEQNLIKKIDVGRFFVELFTLKNKIYYHGTDGLYKISSLQPFAMEKISDKWFAQTGSLFFNEEKTKYYLFGSDEPRTLESRDTNLLYLYRLDDSGVTKTDFYCGGDENANMRPVWHYQTLTRNGSKWLYETYMDGLPSFVMFDAENETFKIIKYGSNEYSGFREKVYEDENLGKFAFDSFRTDVMDKNHIHFQGTVINESDLNKSTWIFGTVDFNGVIDVYCNDYHASNLNTLECFVFDYK